MLLSAIAAMSENRVIGYHNQLPWHLPADLKYFKQVTQGKSIIMGRKTYESIGRPLPNRENIVITRATDATFIAPGCIVVNSIDSALEVVAAQPEAFVIGGAQLYLQLLPRIQRLYLTMIHQSFEGDAFFPQLMMSEWRQISREDHQADEKNPYGYSFVVLERVF